MNLRCSGLCRQDDHKLLGKQDDLSIQNESGATGFVQTNTVVPAYYFADAETRQSYDPVYNPDRYVFVKTVRGCSCPISAENITIFQFLLQNKQVLKAAKTLARLK